MNQRVNPETLIDAAKLWQDNQQAFRLMLSRGLLNGCDCLPAALFMKATPPCFYWGEMSIDDEKQFDRPVTEYQWVTREMVESGQIMVCNTSNEPEGLSPVLRALAHVLGWLELRTEQVHPEHWLMQHLVDLEEDGEEVKVDFVPKASASLSIDSRDFQVHVADAVTVNWRGHQHCFEEEAALSWFANDDSYLGTLVVVGEPHSYDVARIMGDFYDNGEPERACWEYAGDAIGALLHSLNGASAVSSLHRVVCTSDFAALPNVEGSLSLICIKDAKVSAFDAKVLYEVADLLRQDGDHSAAIVAALRPLVELLPD